MNDLLKYISVIAISILISVVGLALFDKFNNSGFKSVKANELTIESEDGRNYIRILAWNPGATIEMVNAKGRHYEISLDSDAMEPTIKTWSYGENNSQW